jgi:hypothetical protein
MDEQRCANAFGAAYRDAIDGAEAAMFSETAVIFFSPSSCSLY